MTEVSAPVSTIMNTKFTVKHAFGSHVTKIDSIQSFSASSGDKDSSDRLVYKIGKQVCVFDAEGGKQEFFDSRMKVVTDVVHFTISANSRFISMCEKVGDASSHIAIYSLSTLNKLKTLNHNSAKTYICSTFCGDPKMIAALTGDLERQIIVWYWEKEKFYKSILINTNAMNINLLRAAPSANIMLTTTGPNCLKYWSVGVDGSLKAGQFLPPSKEGLENFVDHLWLPSSLGQHRLIVLADPDNITDKSMKRQTLFVFEGSDDNPNSHPGAASANNPVAPINMELRQAINLKLELGGRIEKIVSTTKAFMIVGLFGLVCTYERTDDKHEPYIEARRISLGDVHIIGATVPPTEEKMVIVTKTGRMLSVSLDMSVEQLKMSAGMADEDGNASLDDDSNTAISKIGKDDLAGVCDLTLGGFHCQPILAADMAYERALMVTISADSTCRLWNYLTMRCELVHHFRGDEPIAVTIHANGFQLLVSFKDRIRMYNVLMDKLKMAKETILKNCKCMKFSNGSQYFAAASAINIVIYDTKSFTQLQTFQGHMMTVVRLVWAVGDQVVFSAGMDGNIYGWPIAKDGRIDVIAASNRSSAVLDLEVDSPSTVFPVAPKEYDDDVVVGNSGGAVTANKQVVSVPTKVDRWNLIVSSLDGYLRMPSWSMEANVKHKGHSSGRASTAGDGIQMLMGDPSVSITAMQLSNDRTRLFCGTSVGSLRVYSWPPVSPPAVGKDGQPLPAYYEIFTHSQKVVAIKLTPTDNCVVSAAEDGSIFIHNIVVEHVKGDKSAAYDPFEVLDDVATLNNEVVLMSTEDIEDHVNEVVELQKMLSETKAKNDFHARKLESDHNEALKKMNEMHDITVNKEKESFEKQRATFDKRIRELIVSMEGKETDHIKIITELENKYEHKLADQLERYDMLHEKMQLLKQKCEGLLEAEKSNFQKQLVDLKDAAKGREKALQVKHRRAVEDKSANESAFKEIINQQEDEYEDELRQLIHAAESELVSERETILKLRTLVQTKKTKIDQLEKKLQELSIASKARLTLLNQERIEKQKLVDTIEHYKKNLIEREDALAEKEKMVLELRSTTRTLENFRFVLDHRLQQLSSERGPITSHIEGLEKHISTMYEELVEEFNTKKSSSEAASLKDQKIVWISQDLNKMRQSVREKEQHIAAFKRELGNIVSAMVVGKELEESVKLLYKKFVRGETVSKSLSKLNENVADKVDTIMNVKDSDDQSCLSADTFSELFSHWICHYCHLCLLFRSPGTEGRLRQGSERLGGEGGGGGVGGDRQGGRQTEEVRRAPVRQPQAPPVVRQERGPHAGSPPSK
jgi:WD40 repeat protein